MTEAPLLRLCDAQTRLIAELLDRAALANDPDRVRAFLPELIAICEAASASLDALRTALFFGRIKKVEPISLVAREALPRMVSLVESGRRLSRAVAAGSDLGERYERAADRFRTAVEEYLLRWPFSIPTPEQIADAEAAFKRGETIPLGEAFDELLRPTRSEGHLPDQGVGPVAAAQPRDS